MQETNTEAARLTPAAPPGSKCVYHSGAESQRDWDFGPRYVGAREGGEGAVAPARPMSKKVLTNTALGLVLGLMAIVWVVFAREYFREPTMKPSGFQSVPDSCS